MGKNRNRNQNKNKNKNAFQKFINKYGKKDNKISSKDIKNFLGGKGTQSQAQQFLKKAAKQGYKVGSGATRQANKPAPYNEPVGPTPTFGGGSSGGGTGPYYSGGEFDLAAWQTMQGTLGQQALELNAQSNASAEIIANIRSTADKYVADAAAGASMYGADRQLDIAKTTSAATERYQKYIADQQRASASEVAEIKGKYGLDLQNIVNAGLKDVAKISGEFGLEGEKVRGEYALEGERLKGATARDVAQRNKEAAIFGGLMSAFNF